MMYVVLSGWNSLCEITGIKLAYEDKPFNFTDPHSLTGQLAIWLMLAHAIWATIVIIKVSEKARVGFHKYSLIVWLIWLIPYLSGMFLGMSR